MCSLLLLVARPIVQSCVKLKTGIWDRDPSRGLELQGKTLALLGNSLICSEIAKRLSPFGVNVICYVESSLSSSLASLNQSPNKTKSDSKVTNQLPMEEMCSKGDLFCFILNNEKVKSLFTIECLRKFKQGIRVVCHGLPSACPETDLLEALNNGKISALALDLDESTAGRSRKLIEHPNVICTPALSDATFESQTRLSNSLTNQIQTILQGKAPPECINPQVLIEPSSST